MLSNSRRPPTAEELASVESKLKAPLPPRYRTFIQQYNGGIPQKPMYNPSDGEGAYLQTFYAIGNHGRNLGEEMLIHGLPKGLIAIGLLGDGGKLCLNLTDDSIYLWAYDDVEEMGGDCKITWACVRRVEPDIFAFFDRLEGDEEEEHDEPDPIAEMATRGDVRQIEDFVRSGGDFRTARTNYGETILQVAIMQEDFAFCAECLRLGAPLSGALHTAAKWNQPDAVEWLLSQGANINEVDEEGRTPLDYATWGAKLVLTKRGARHASELK